MYDPWALPRQQRYPRFTVYFGGGAPTLIDAGSVLNMGGERRTIRRWLGRSLLHGCVSLTCARNAGIGWVLCGGTSPAFGAVQGNIRRSLQIMLDGRPVFTVDEAACFQRETFGR
ncbi:hypothetical protein B0T11DRAFT_298788 [Plectosphaerella cucumerina]|uniref:Uncharacterized protein n=1 Tax=Plectosphaerella cucumerina TaxID=40658 RepID=A0A8K0TL90_9PEZI|nr:hypothetical protein B0T11DRAFT_298788 [Plectosphaerella cucumerina]